MGGCSFALFRCRMHRCSRMVAHLSTAAKTVPDSAAHCAFQRMHPERQTPPKGVAVVHTEIRMLKLNAMPAVQ